MFVWRGERFARSAKPSSAVVLCAVFVIGITGKVEKVPRWQDYHIEVKY